jgi:hypothetical protein
MVDLIIQILAAYIMGILLAKLDLVMALLAVIALEKMIDGQELLLIMI